MPVFTRAERDRALEDSLRTQVFAEDRVAHAELVHQNGRQQHYHHEQHGVLEIPQRLQPVREDSFGEGIWCSSS